MKEEGDLCYSNASLFLYIQMLETTITLQKTVENSTVIENDLLTWGERSTASIPECLF